MQTPELMEYFNLRYVKKVSKSTLDNLMDRLRRIDIFCYHPEDDSLHSERNLRQEPIIVETRGEKDIYDTNTEIGRVVMYSGG